MLESVRQYAAERLSASGETADMESRHGAFFLALAVVAQPLLKGPEQVAWLNRLESEHDNFRAALDVLSNETALPGLRLTGALSSFWDIRGYLSEGREHPARSLDGYRTQQTISGGTTGIGTKKLAGKAEPEAEANTVVAYTLRVAGWLASRQGDQTSARSLLDESLALYREFGSKRDIANALLNLGAVAAEQGDNVQASSLYNEALALYRELGNKSGIARGLDGMAAARWGKGDREQAIALWGAASVLRESLGAPLLPFDQAEVDAGLAQARGRDGRGCVRLCLGRGLRDELGPGGRIRIELVVEAEPCPGPRRWKRRLKSRPNLSAPD